MVQGGVCSIEMKDHCEGSSECSITELHGIGGGQSLQFSRPPPPAFNEIKGINDKSGATGTLSHVISLSSLLKQNTHRKRKMLTLLVPWEGVLCGIIETASCNVRVGPAQSREQYGVDAVTFFLLVNKIR